MDPGKKLSRYYQKTANKKIVTELKENQDKVKLEGYFIGRLPGITRHKYHNKVR